MDKKFALKEAEAIAFIDYRQKIGQKRRLESGEKHFITISRQTGAAGPAFFEMLSSYLVKHDPESHRWMVFEKNLIKKVLDEHHMSLQVAPYMNEETAAEINDTLEELFGMHPARWTLVHKTSETILHLAQLGHSIIVGRASNTVTRKLPGGLHVRLVASLENRLQRIQGYYRLDRKNALEFIKQEERDKKAYMKKYFSKDINDLSQYDLVINTDLLCYEDAVRVIGSVVLNLNPVYDPLSEKNLPE